MQNKKTIAIAFLRKLYLNHKIYNSKETVVGLKDKFIFQLFKN